MIFKGRSTLRKHAFRLSAGLVLLAAALSLSDFAAASIYAFRKPASADIKYYYNVASREKVVALTFDDGPHPDKTPQIMETLERNGATATFFFLGSNALRHPAIVKDAHDRGFEIGNHTFTHSYAVHESPKRIRYELGTTNKIIENITGVPTVLYRPPYLLDIGGDPTYDPVVHEEVLEWVAESGYVVVGADVDSKDWAVATEQELVDNVVRELESGKGQIVLLHDGGDGPHTVEALETLVIELKARGYRFATVSELLGLNAVESMRVATDLVPGMAGEAAAAEVRALQLFLIKEGYHFGAMNGDFDEETEGALRRWQKDHGIVREAGVVGPTTRGEISRVLDEEVIDTKSSSFVDIPFAHGQMQETSVFAFAALGNSFTALAFVLLCLTVARLAFVLELFVARRVAGFKEPDPWNGGVSVVIPVYNEEENIRTTIESVLRSTRMPDEVIVVDDGSTDSSAAVVEAVAREFPGVVRLVRTRNGGKARALNLGLGVASHEVVVTMDGDTIFDRSAIEALVGHFNDPKVGAVAGKVSVTKANGIINHFQRIEYVVAQNIDKAGLSLINSVGVVPGPIGAWRKRDIVSAGGYKSDTLVEDQELTLGLLAQGRRIAYEPRAVAYTETPFTFRDFVKQRYRWVFGTLQCAWKYRSYALSVRRPSLGWVVLPSTALTLAVSLLYPLLDLLLLSGLVLGFWSNVLGLYFAFTLIDMLYAAVAFEQEKGSRRVLALLPLQRIFYRFVIYYVVVRSFIQAIEGTEALWNKVKKRGAAEADLEPVPAAA